MDFVVDDFDKITQMNDGTLNICRDIQKIPCIVIKENIDLKETDDENISMIIAEFSNNTYLIMLELYKSKFYKLQMNKPEQFEIDVLHQLLTIPRLGLMIYYSNKDSHPVYRIINKKLKHFLTTIPNLTNDNDLWEFLQTN